MSEPVAAVAALTMEAPIELRAALAPAADAPPWQAWTVPRRPLVPLTALLPPITLATIVNVFLFALAWKQHQAELKTGKYPWPLFVGTTLYGSSIGAFLYLRMDKPVGSNLDHFMMALAAEAMGALVAFGLLNAPVLTKGKLIDKSLFYIVASLGLLALLIGAAFQ